MFILQFIVVADRRTWTLLYFIGKVLIPSGVTLGLMYASNYAVHNIQHIETYDTEGWVYVKKVDPHAVGAPELNLFCRGTVVLSRYESSFIMVNTGFYKTSTCS